MKEPGRILLWIARKVCGPRSVECVVLPSVLDLRQEWMAAIGAGARWRAAAIWIAGSVRVAQALLLQGAIDAWRGSAPSERRELALADLLAFTSLAFTAACLLLLRPIRINGEYPPFGLAAQVWLLACRLPGFATSLLPASLLPGVLLALRRAGGEATRRAEARVLTASCLISATAFLSAAWVAPVANRQTLFLLATASGDAIPAELEPRELTIDELRHELAELEEVWPGVSTRLRVERSKRFASPITAIVFALLALALARLGAARNVASCLCVSLVVLVGYFGLLRVGEQAAVQLAIPAVLGAWLPVATLALVAVLAFCRGSSRSSKAPATA